MLDVWENPQTLAAGSNCINHLSPLMPNPIKLNKNVGDLRNPQYWGLLITGMNLNIYFYSLYF